MGTHSRLLTTTMEFACELIVILLERVHWDNVKSPGQRIVSLRRDTGTNSAKAAGAGMVIQVGIKKRGVIGVFLSLNLPQGKICYCEFRVSKNRNYSIGLLKSISLYWMSSKDEALF